MKIYRIAQEVIEEPQNEEVGPEAVEVMPPVLYHGTDAESSMSNSLKEHLNKIKQHGLGAPNVIVDKTFDGSKTGVVYLTGNLERAIYYANVRSLSGGTAVLEVNTQYLDKNQLFVDENTTDPFSYEYHGVIPSSALKVIKEQP